MNRQSISPVKIITVATLVIICASFLVLLGLINLFSPRTIRAPFFLGQAWSCHYLSQGLESVGLHLPADQVQKWSIEGYDNASKNLDSYQITALWLDEQRVLADRYIHKGNYDSAGLILEKVEVENRKQLLKDFPDKDRWMRGLATELLNHARILAAQDKRQLAAQKYQDCLEVFDQLKKLNMADAETEETRRVACKELEKLQAVKVDSRSIRR